MVGTGQEQRRDEDVALDLSGILAAIWRRRLSVLVVTAVAGLGAFGILWSIPPTFQAETKILIENRSVDLRQNAGSGEDRTLIDQEGVASQVQLLLSRDLARQVAQAEGLADKPEFDGSRGSLVGSLLAGAGLADDPMRLAPEERVLDAFAKRLQAYRVEGSRVVVVEFSSEDPELASRVANAVVETYMSMQSEAKRRTSEDQTRWLGEEIETLSRKVREAESAVEAYRSDNDLFVGENNASLARQQMSALTGNLTILESERDAIRSRVDLLKGLLSSGGDLTEAAEGLDTEVFRELRNREAGLRATMSERAVTLLPAHPQMRAIAAQIEEVRRLQRAEGRRILAGLENDLKIAEQRIAALSETLEQRKGTSAQNSESEVELRALERDAASQRELLKGLMDRYREAVARQNAETMPADARVISRAAPPVEPTFPKVGPLTVVATIAGLLLSMAWIVTAEFLSGRALKPIASTPPVPVAVEPLVALQPSDAGSRAAPPHIAQPGAAADSGSAHPPTIEDEIRATVFRSLEPQPVASPIVSPLSEVPTPAIADAPTDASTLQRARPAGPVLTSDLPTMQALILADGTTRMAVMGIQSAFSVEAAVAALASGATASGAKVVVVDTVPSHAGIGGPGLSDLVRGEAPFSDVIRRNPATRAHEIGVGRRPLDAAMLTGPEMMTLIDALEHTYDLVVLDLGVIDGEPGRFQLVSHVEHTILVGEAADPDVARLHGLLTGDGRARVTVIAPDITAAIGAAA